MAHKRIFALALAGAALLSLTACGGTPSSSQEDTSQNTPAGVAVQVETVATQDISTENKVSGTVTADSEATIFVATSAKCTAVYVDAGDLVNAGQAICTLDLASTLASYQAANISYQSAVQSYQDQAAIFDKQIALYEKNLNDLKALFEIGAASQTEIDTAELTLMNARATRESTLAQLEAEDELSAAQVKVAGARIDLVTAYHNYRWAADCGILN